VRPQAQLANLERFQSNQIASAELDFAGVGPDDAANDIEQGGLTSPVGADQPHDLARLDLERYIVKGLQAPE
jgi:hypothetical protein